MPIYYFVFVIEAHGLCGRRICTTAQRPFRKVFKRHSNLRYLSVIFPDPCCTIMQAPSHDLVTQFTEDAFAKEDRVCQRSKCKALIRRGDPCHYVAAYNPAQPGKFVCVECFRWYQNKPATTARAHHTQGISAFPLLPSD